MAASHRKRVSSGRMWTPEEDGLLVAHMDRAGKWVGWRELLPDRTPAAIDERRYERGLTNPDRAPVSRWSRAQRDALLRGMRELCEEVGHDPYEVMAETHRLLARAAQKRRNAE